MLPNSMNYNGFAYWPQMISDYLMYIMGVLVGNELCKSDNITRTHSSAECSLHASISNLAH